MKKIKIISCMNPSFWYRSLIGMDFETEGVVKVPAPCWKVKLNGEIKYIAEPDAELIK